MNKYTVNFEGHTMTLGGDELLEFVKTAVVAARECIMAQVPSMLASVLAKAGKQRND